MTEPKKNAPLENAPGDSEIRVAVDFIEGIWGKPETDQSPQAAAQTLGQKAADTSNDAFQAQPSSPLTRDVSFPESIGRFQLLGKLGEGGFAKVFLAQDPTLNRKVALKVLKPTQFFSDDTTARFDREAQAAAVLNHPNIVPVFETGSFGNDRYIASAFSDGLSLEKWMKQDLPDIHDGVLSPQHASAMVLQLADAVYHAHQRGIIHRDLKPANILVEKVTDEVEPHSSRNNALGNLLKLTLRITDFGLARYNDSLDQFQTTEGAIVGTPAYMSPEQASGKLDLDFRTDIYSLGVILYELLTGKLPIEGETHIDTLLAIGQTIPKPPTKWNAEVPRDLEAICLKCLEKSPQHRYPTALALANDLQHWLSGEPVSARPTTKIEKVGKWCRRNPLLTTAFAAISLALVIALTQWMEANRQGQIAQAENERSKRAIAFSQETLREMIGRVAGMQKLPVAIRQELTQRAVTLQNRLLEEDPENDELKYNTANAYLHLGRVLTDLQDYGGSIECYGDGLSLLDSMENLDGEDELRARLTTAKAGAYRLLGDFDKAAELLAIDPTADPKGTRNEATRLRDVGHNLVDAGDPASGLIQLQRSAIIYETLNDDLISLGNYVFCLYLQSQAEIDLGLLMDAEQTLTNALDKQQFIISQASFHERMEEMLGMIEKQLGKVQDELGENGKAQQQLLTATERYEMLCEWAPKTRRYLDGLLEIRLRVIGIHLQEEAFGMAQKSLAETAPWVNKLSSQDQNFTVLVVAYCKRLIAVVDLSADLDEEQRDELLLELEKHIGVLTAAESAPDKVASLQAALNELRN